MYGTLDVLGREFPKSAQSVAEATIIGVAADAHSIKVEANDVAELYLPLTPKDFSYVYLVARARTDADRLPPILREAATPRPARHPDRAGDARGFRSAHAGPAPGERDCRRHRRADAGAGVPRNFRRGVVRRGAADEGDRHQGGARRAAAGAAASDRPAGPDAGRRRRR